MSGTKKKLIKFMRQNGNQPVSYYDLMKNVTSGMSLAKAVEEMLVSCELEEVPDKNMVLLRLADETTD